MSNSREATEYFRWFYDQGVWKRMHYRGVRILKVPSDLWNYQEIFAEHRVEWVLETWNPPRRIRAVLSPR